MKKDRCKRILFFSLLLVFLFTTAHSDIPQTVDAIPLKLNYTAPSVQLSLQNDYLTLVTDWAPVFGDTVNVRISYTNNSPIKLTTTNDKGVFQSRYKEDSSSLLNIESIVLESIAANDKDSEMIILDGNGKLIATELKKGLEFATYTTQTGGTQGYGYSYGLEKANSDTPLVDYVVYFDSLGNLKTYRVRDTDDRELTYSGDGELQAVERLIRSSSTGLLQRIHWDFSSKRWLSDTGEVVNYDDSVYNAKDTSQAGTATQPAVATLPPVTNRITPSPKPSTTPQATPTSSAGPTASGTPGPTATSTPGPSPTPVPSPTPTPEPYIVKAPPVNLKDLQVYVNPESLYHHKLGAFRAGNGKASLQDVGYTSVTLEWNSGSVSTEVSMAWNASSRQWECSNMPNGLSLSAALIRVTGADGLTTTFRNASVISSYFTMDPSLELLGDDTYRYDGTGRENVTALYAREGELSAYSYHTQDESKKITYNPYGDVLSYTARSQNGKWYAYSPEAGWSEQNEQGLWVSCEKPQDVNPSDLPPLLVLERKKKPDPVWYPNNTVGVIGISLRDEIPGLTSKWYNVLPVDLSRNGIQSYKLVAANMFYIGRVYVNVIGDTVTVDYQLASGHVYPKKDFYCWFRSLDEITGEFLENPTGGFRFGRPYSRSEDLGGQDIALLFVCNTVTYRQPVNNNGGMLVRFWPNIQEVQDHRQRARELLWKMEAAQIR